MQMNNQLKNYINQYSKILEEEMSKIYKIQTIYINTRFKDNIWAADLAEIESLSSKNMCD